MIINDDNATIEISCAISCSSRWVIVLCQNKNPWGGEDSFQFSATKTKANEPAFGIAIISVFVYPNQRSSCFNSMWSTCD